MIHKFTATRNQKALKEFLNELFAEVEKQDLYVVKIEVKRKNDYNALLKFCTDLGGSIWGVQKRDIKHNKRLVTDFAISAEDEYEVTEVGDFIIVSKEEEERMQALQNQAYEIRQQLWRIEQEQHNLTSQLLNKYRGKEYRLKGIVR